MLKPGLYEQIISQKLGKELDGISDERKRVEKLDGAEAPLALAGYVAAVTRQALNGIEDEEERVRLVNQMLGILAEKRADLAEQSVDERFERLLQLMSSDDPYLVTKGKAKDLPRPETPMAVSSLFTGAKHEPQMFSELNKEIASADRIDMLVSFVKMSGLNMIRDALAEFANRGGKLRVITTSYMGATDAHAVDELAALPGAEVKVSYDTKSTRLHAKAYVFYRDTEFTTAYVGSSNLSNAAMSSGLEWNLKLTAVDQPDTMKKIYATFDTYWNSDEFEKYSKDDQPRLESALKGEKYRGEKPEFYFDIRPYHYQQAILDQLRAEREVRGYYRNLIVAATGTGKTVIAALDYRSWVKAHPKERNRLLFIAHREEILKQSQYTFQAALKDANFGELWVGGYQAARTDYLFVSVQTLNSQALWKRLPADYYDYIIVDETHHAAADSYAEALKTFQPKVLLGLTATPERLDGKSILQFFDNRIAAEIRLPEAIDRKLLCPFQYFGVSDTIDLTELKWTRGGYDKTELDRVYTMTGAVAERRADHVIRNLVKYSADLDEVKALGFCVSIAHAEFMAKWFNDHSIPARALSSASGDEERRNVKKALISGEIRVIFTVDLYNEGVDIPEVNTVLFLRPTESLTIFLQQLGRGLRLCEGKGCLTVLDFIGAANKHYRFEEKFAAMLVDSRHSVQEEIERGFVSVPKGCFIHLEKKAKEAVLDNIRQSLSRKNEMVNRLRAFQEENGREVSLAAFLDWYHMTPADLYARGDVTFSRLCAAAEIREDFHEDLEGLMEKVMYRLTGIDSRRWIRFLLDFLPRIDDTDFEKLDPMEERMLKMFYMTIWDKYVDDWETEEVLDHLYTLSDSPVMLSEIQELLRYQYDHIDFIDSHADLGFACPLDVHCSYSQRQLLTALDYANYSAMRQGVLWLKDKNMDIFLITLNKSEKDYSPTTMYEDYAINQTLFHWQSQSVTSADSPTGQRYIHHRENGHRILLFVREFKKDDKGNTMPYTFLGLGNYVSHQGSKPMSIVWRLEKEIPAKYLQKIQQAMG